MVKVYISYISQEHKERVLELSNRLVVDGIDCLLDQYIESPPEGWPEWQRHQFEEADFVLAICTEFYARRYEDKEKAGMDLGVKGDSTRIKNYLNENKGKNYKVIPVCMERSDVANIPVSLQPFTRYVLDIEGEYRRLYRRLTKQPLVIKPPLGVIKNGDERKPRKGAEHPFLWISEVEITNFRAIGHLSLDLSRQSELPGNWTCIAGINGSGKSSVLQALCLALLGERLVPEIGLGLLGRMCRRDNGDTKPCEIRLSLKDARADYEVLLPLDGEGLDQAKLRAQADYEQMLACWERLASQIVVSYGASRNLSDYRDSRHSAKSKKVQGQMTLFDPLTQIANINSLLDSKDLALAALLKKVLASVLSGSGLTIDADAPTLIFQMHGVSVPPMDLPDGFRSTFAWLADLCASWLFRSGDDDAEPKDIEAIVLLDEIDLHLHPSLQRSLVPQLREAMPRIQWVVTTHSPLVLASFDRNEIVALDAEKENGIRELGRQILGFTTNEVYEWLMNTPPRSAVIEMALQEPEAISEEVALWLDQGPDTDEAEARDRASASRKLRISS